MYSKQGANHFIIKILQVLKIQIYIYILKLIAKDMFLELLRPFSTSPKEENGGKGTA